jgi:hypothetical protein
MDVSQAQQAKRMRHENARLRKPVADLRPDKEALQSVIEKTEGAKRSAVEGPAVVLLLTGRAPVPYFQ